LLCFLPKRPPFLQELKEIAAITRMIAFLPESNLVMFIRLS